MYQWTETRNSGGHFWFPKSLIENMNWAALPQSSKAVFPVLAIHADDRGIAYPSEDRIAAMAGITEKTARQGLRGLNGFPAFIGSHYYRTKRGKRGRKYQVLLPRKGNTHEDMLDKGLNFPFHRLIIEGGNWSQLLPTARAIYLAMRYFGFFEEYLYNEHQDPDFSFSDEYPQFLDRRCDFCNADFYQLARHAGIHRNQVSTALDNLIKYHLAERITDNLTTIYKVYLRPPYIYKTSYLNEQTMKRRKAQS